MVSPAVRQQLNMVDIDIQLEPGLSLDDIEASGQDNEA